jgi:hypothetical protein
MTKTKIEKKVECLHLKYKEIFPGVLRCVKCGNPKSTPLFGGYQSPREVNNIQNYGERG